MTVKMTARVGLPLICLRWAYDINPQFSSTRRGVPRLDRALDGAPCLLNGTVDVSTYQRQQARVLISRSKAVQRILFHVRKACNPENAAQCLNYRAKARKTKRFQPPPHAPRDRRR